MASVPKTLEVVAARTEGPDTRVLGLAEIGGTGFWDIGGKYIIVHTGLVRGERAIKRAYSLMPRDGHDRHAEIVVKRVGIGAGAMHEAEVGTRFTFSGPWGKLAPEGGFAERTLLVATDTGITSALGVAEDAARRSARREFTVLWLRAPSETFLDTNTVRARIERAGSQFRIATIPEVGAAERADFAFRLIAALALESSATHVVATGDGAIVFPLRARLPVSVAGVREVRIECFFNNPEKKSV